MRIVFFGTPLFAVPSLEALLADGAPVVAVVTQPDQPQGRSRSTLIPPPVKVAAESEELTIFQPEKPTALWCDNHIIRLLGGGRRWPGR